MRRAGVIKSAARTSRTVQRPEKWITSVTGRAPSCSKAIRPASHSAGATASAKAAIFSGDQRPDFSRSSGMLIYDPLIFAQAKIGHNLRFTDPLDPDRARLYFPPHDWNGSGEQCASFLALLS